MNFMHIILIVFFLILIKITILTNKNVKVIFKQLLVLSCITILLIVISLGIKKPLFEILSIDDDDYYDMISLIHLDEGRLYVTVGSDTEAEILTILGECKIGYSLKCFSEVYEASTVVMTVSMIVENRYVSFGITDDGLIQDNGKYYRILDNDILGKLTAILSSDTNTRKWD